MYMISILLSHPTKKMQNAPEMQMNCGKMGAQYLFDMRLLWSHHWKQENETLGIKIGNENTTFVEILSYSWYVSLTCPSDMRLLKKQTVLINVFFLFYVVFNLFAGHCSP